MAFSGKVLRRGFCSALPNTCPPNFVRHISIKNTGRGVLLKGNIPRKRMILFAGCGFGAYGGYRASQLITHGETADNIINHFLPATKCESASGINVSDLLSLVGDEEEDEKEEDTFYRRNQSVILTSGTVMVTYLSQEYLGGAIGFLVGCAWGGVIGVLYGINFGIQLTLASIEEMNAVDDEGDS
eukprot:m.113170 g.113170  ORF g.113170 m.113170 type:complete len:185 (-) comp17065_c0_seq1:124-678(-)